MADVYIPNYNASTYPCVVVQSNGVLRAYHAIPRNSQSVDYTDFYVSMDYMERGGTQNFSSNANLPVCYASNRLTDVEYYRVDFVNIVIMFSLLAYLLFYLPSKLILTLFIRR